MDEWTLDGTYQQWVMVHYIGTRDLRQNFSKTPFSFVLCLAGFEGAKNFRDLSKLSDCIQNVCNRNVCSLWIDIHPLKCCTSLEL